MSSLKQIIMIDLAKVLALDEAGLLWHGVVLAVKDDKGRASNDVVIDWKPINNPPDGRHLSDRQVSWWDKKEQEAREAAKSSPNPKGTPLSVAQEGEDVTEGAVTAPESPSDDRIEDGKGVDTN